ncbi:cupin-like domain-containing protein [Cocleimonas sp. KMM 6892]|uniref:cupin-like domain-containing protein n=1 Tax=unclassified Cocleimonas TaxID=2639732 RepID=UPI002DB99170|nr:MULTISPECIES: cupin-like domain-containing protein [unclassified Cocleimonas]MEB8432445.1 cupin-like domain-containing protein [Cocleimonas sp. KMM 6892]MEC4715304.1 cupin-like domain-containing protein [Cocleimonas sp. KMM 6895]MEC4745077.1 cupin-like domain-containing protein [Cocleimonas sp. KMM 6896]
MFEKIAPNKVKRVSEITKEQFLKNHKDTGIPVILPTLMEDWPAKEKWDVDYLIETLGDEVVPVYSSKPAVGKSHQHAAAREMPLRDYLNLLKNGENDLRMFFYNILNNAPQMIKDFSYPDIGLKFFKKLPVLFVGGRGAKVQMHYDIDLANLILCHFGGVKKVLLIPPEQTQFMYKVPFSFSALYDVDFLNPDFEKYPALKYVKGYEAELKHGDALFIPSGYWHYIVYEDIGFSMTLRAFPTKFSQRLSLLKNIFVTRTVEGLMRKTRGQAWNDRNERKAVEITNRNIPSA